MINYSVAMFQTAGNIALICFHELTMDKVRIWRLFCHIKPCGDGSIATKEE